jgi:hypothetical protein
MKFDKIYNYHISIQDETLMFEYILLMSTVQWWIVFENYGICNIIIPVILKIDIFLHNN